jgi:two-component system LytT family response regulator
VKPLRALVVDDERLARRELRYLLAAHPEVEVVGEAASLEEAREAVERLRPELVFLDIQLGNESGFELLERTRLPARVVFVTAHDEFALRAFEVNALDYLVKPVRADRLREAIERARSGVGEAPATGRLDYGDPVFVSVDGAPRLVRLPSIACIRAEGDYTRLVGLRSPIGLVLKPLKEWERVLPERQFCRIERSSIVNCEHVSRFEPWFSGGYLVHLAGVPEPVVMSRRYARRFRARFGI